MNINPLGFTAVILLTFVIGVFVGNLTARPAGKAIDMGTVSEMTESAKDAVTSTVTGNANTEGSTQTVTEPDGVAFTINVSNLPDSQKTMLRTMGVEGNEIEITNGMMACAEAKVGSERLRAIRDGASPSISEGFSLMSCYSAG